MAKVNRSVRQTGGYHRLTDGISLSSVSGVLQRRQARVENCKSALKAATREGDMARIRKIKAHLAWAQDRLANTSERAIARSPGKARRRNTA